MSGIREREAVNNVCITTRAQSFSPNKGWFELTMYSAIEFISSRYKTGLSLFQADCHAPRRSDPGCQKFNHL